MKEIYTNALVLSRRGVNEIDGVVTIFTEDFGKISARAKSIRKILSKLSAHLQPLSFIKVRLIKLAGPSDGYSVVDCLSDDDMSDFKTTARYDLLPIISFLDGNLYDLQTDRKLWFFLREVFSKNYSPKDVAKVLLKILGFDQESAECFRCGTKAPSAFLKNDNIFLCDACASKFTPDKILYIK